MAKNSKISQQQQQKIKPSGSQHTVSHSVQLEAAAAAAAFNAAAA